MTSGTFRTTAISSIIINPDRQRQDLGNIEELAESIARIGLINPIVIDSDGVLVAGERRLTACRSLGWTSIIVQHTSDLSPYELQCIEFEENDKRKDLTWQEECAAIEKFHLLKLEHEPDWNAEKTAEALGITPQTAGRKLSVARELVDDRVAGAEKFSKALNLVQRSTERRKSTVLAAVEAQVSVSGLSFRS